MEVSETIIEKILNDNNFSTHNVSITRTDIENLGQYVEKFHVYLG